MCNYLVLNSNCTFDVTRAPFSEVQTEDWDCSSAVRWDPRHSDCAVPQVIFSSVKNFQGS